MRIVDIREESADGWRSKVATVLWEKRRRPPQELYFATDEASAEMLSPSPDALLLAALEAAAYHHEKRIEVESEVCPTLVKGLYRAMEIHYSWFRDAPPIEIDVAVAGEPSTPSPGSRAALMVSGGVDALASLRANRLNHEPHDPGFFVHGLVVSSGFEAFEMLPGSWYWEYLEALAKDTALRLVPVKTNMRELEPAEHFFAYRLFGATLASSGHALSSGVNLVAIGSAGLPTESPRPEGSHPAVDPLYSSGAVRVVHDLHPTDRFDKTALLSDWELVSSRLRVCFHSNRLPAGQQNCGRCEKCLRTMLTLVALGKLAEFEAFEESDVSADLLRDHLHLSHHIIGFYPRVISELSAVGRHDLVDVIRERMEEARTEANRVGRRLNRFERERLGGALRRFKRRLLR